MIDKEKLVVFDIETIINISTFCFLDYKTKKKREFILFKNDDEFNKLIKFLFSLKNNKYTLVGFNSVGFDCQIIEYILLNYKNWQGLSIQNIVTFIYNEAQRIVNLSDEEKFKSLIYESKFNIPSIDLYLQKHYNRPAKATSLKWLQFTMRYKNIEEMPIPHNVNIKEEMIPKILSYNWNDVESTADFFERIMFETDLRVELSNRFNLSLINAPEPKIARDIFGKYLSEDMGISYTNLKKMQTHRTHIDLKDIIFSYITFNNPIFNSLLTILKNTSLKPEDKFEKKLDVYGLGGTFGLGGLHSNNKPKIFESNNNEIIITSDVASYYPNLAIENKIYPLHLGKSTHPPSPEGDINNSFVRVYKNIYEERKKYDKKNPLNYVYKIILNSN